MFKLIAKLHFQVIIMAVKDVQNKHLSLIKAIMLPSNVD